MTSMLVSFGDVMGYVLYILLAVLILLVMITVHEFGHFIAGKILKFKIDEFSVGFGPKIFQKKKKNGELISLRAIPLGGYCAFRGEDGDDKKPDNREHKDDSPFSEYGGASPLYADVKKESDTEDAVKTVDTDAENNGNDGDKFTDKAPWKRIIVLISGALMNYILAVLVIITMFGIYGQTTLIAVKTVKATEIAEEYQFKPYDIILSANGKTVYIMTDLMDAINGKKKGDRVPFSVWRGGEHGVNTDVLIEMREDATFINIEDAETLYLALGFYYEKGAEGKIINGGLYSTSIRLGFFGTIGRSFEYSLTLGGTLFKALGQLITGRLGLSAIGGTITTISVTAEAIKLGGLRYFFNIAGLIGVNLAVFNLLPIPALDGSRVVFCFIEWIIRRPINRKVEAAIHAVGFALIFGFAIMVDVVHLF